MKHWEYLQITRAYDVNTRSWSWEDDREASPTPLERLNHLGRKGWELVSVVPLSIWNGYSGSGQTTAVTWYLKRLQQRLAKKSSNLE